MYVDTRKVKNMCDFDGVWDSKILGTRRDGNLFWEWYRFPRILGFSKLRFSIIFGFPEKAGIADHIGISVCVGILECVIFENFGNFENPQNSINILNEYCFNEYWDLKMSRKLKIQNLVSILREQYLWTARR